MGITVNVEENRSIRVTNQIVGTASPSRVEFAAEGVITMTPDLLGRFEGVSLRPVEIELSIAGSRTVAVDLSAEPSLRLETVDVGVETPDTGHLSPGLETDRSSADDDSASDAHPGAIAFTVEGAITDVPAETIEPLSEAASDPAVATITFAVEDPIRSDGGSGGDLVLEITLLGYGISVYRDGTIAVGTDGLASDVGLL